MIEPQLTGYAVRMKDLKVSFCGQLVIEVPELDMAEGLIHVVSGPSGSGKTSLLRAINRLNECYPHCGTSGEIFLRLNDRPIDIQALPVSRLAGLRQQVAMVFQSPNVLPGSIARNLLLPLKLSQHIKGAAAEQRCREALEQAKLWNEVKERMNHPANSLSGGQQQRLCLARALLLNPRILLLDEPTASLDPEVTSRIEELLLELRGRFTMILVSHSRRQATRLADCRYFCEQGKVTMVSPS